MTADDFRRRAEAWLPPRHAEWALAVTWLTRLPWPWPEAAAGRRLAQAAWAFPLVGALVGGAGGVVLMVMASAGASPLLAAVAAVAAMILATGLLHEDAVADTCDGFGRHGSREARLDAMRDSRIGAFGVAGLALLLLGRVAALAAFATPAAAAAALIAAAAVGRLAAVVLMATLPPARPDGNGAAAGRPDAGRIAAAGLLTPAVLLACGAAGTPAAVLAAAAATALLAVRATGAFGGQTGDVLGAAIALAEIVVLTALAMAQPTA